MQESPTEVIQMIVKRYKGKVELNKTRFKEISLGNELLMMELQN